MPPPKPKVMLIDDSRTVADLVARELSGRGYEVVAHTKPLGTMVAILREMPDLILLDIEMPLLNGVQLCALLKGSRAMAKLATTPVVLFSSVPEAELKELARTCGAQGCVSKSVPPEAIAATVARCLRAAEGLA